jgi:hypothetical protein
VSSATWTLLLSPGLTSALIKPLDTSSVEEEYLYWLFSDLMGIPNLQEQAQNYLKGLLFRSRKRKWIPRKRERIIFRLYAFASSLFLIYFSWLVLKVTPHLLKSYPRTILMTGRRLYEGIMTLSPEVIIASSTMLLIELGMCLSLLYFLFSSLRRLVRWLSKQILSRPVHSAPRQPGRYELRLLAIGEPFTRLDLLSGGERASLTAYPQSSPRILLEVK